MSLYERVLEMCDDLGLSKSDLISMLNCSRATFYRFKNNPKVRNFNHVFENFKDIYDLNYLRNGNRVTVEVTLPKGMRVNKAELEKRILETADKL